MNVTIRGKGRKPDVVLTDDRLICGGEEFPYRDMQRIWTGTFLGTATVDCTYKGRHHGFKIDSGALEEAKKAAEEAQRIIDGNVGTEMKELAGCRDAEKLFAFVEKHGLKEMGVSAKWFCPRMEHSLGLLREGEQVLLPFEAACGLNTVTTDSLSAYTALTQAQMAVLVTDQRILAYTSGIMGAKDHSRNLPYEKFRAFRVLRRGLTMDVVLAGKDQADSLAFTMLGPAHAGMLANILRERVEEKK